ncbi:MAG: glycosyltransferase [Bacteroidetes bacterium B1(2017)]|nr:MAG: glycosyltransferase [Bacteroidetes bacterium B1(2017)]
MNNIVSMKIVVNTRALMPNKLDGIGWFTFQTLKRITQNNPEHEFIFLFDRPFSKEFIFSKNVKGIVLFPPARHPFLYVIYYQWSVRNILKKIKPDVFLAPDGLVALGSKTKQLAVVHDINFLHYPKDLGYFYSKYYSYFVPKFIQEAKRVATVSEFSKQDICKSYQVNPNKIDVVFNGINEGYKPLLEETKQLVRDQYANSKPYFIFVGSLSPRKNLIRLVQAFTKFKKESQSDFQLVLVGSSFWGEKELDDALKNSPYFSEIHIVGRLAQENLELVMGSAFALAFVSYFEGFGIPLIEAMQCDIPVLCSNTSCMPEIAENAALYVDPFDVSSIATGMKQLYDSPKLVGELIENGRQQRQKFSWDLTSNNLWNSILKTISEN